MVTAVSRLSPWLLVATACIAAGAGLPRHPVATAVLVLTVVSCPLLARRGSLIWWDLVSFVLGAALILGYGFANVGFASRVPIPLDVVVLALLFGRCLLFNRWSWPASCSLFAGALFVVACVRLFFDYPVWGNAALRDFTLYVELGFLLVGYWAMLEFGLDRWRRSLKWIFLAQLAYFALYPIRGDIQSLSPQVGLQKAVPLLGNYEGYSPAVVSAFLFFALVQPLRRGNWIAALYLVPVAVIQERGLYIATAGAILMVLVLARSRSGFNLRKRVAIALMLGVLALGVTGATGISGRLSTVSPAFFVAQVKTLTGQAGPGAGSADARREWLHETLQRVRSTPNGWLYGVGFGPDLAFGFQSGAVRKPHDDYLEMFARLGSVGILLFSALLVSLLVYVASAVRRATAETGPFLWWTLGTAVAYLIVAGTQPLLAYPYGTMPLFLACGAGLALARKRQASIPRTAVRRYGPPNQRVAPSAP
jgi:hypothetical protein